jgi:SAM-dependent methyltransferase
MTDSRNVYDHPKYYDLAFSFRDIHAEVSIFEQCFRRFSRIPVRDVLELACGTAPHMEELAKRRYRYTGLDISPEMIAYARRRARQIGIDADFFRADMCSFAVTRPMDFVYTMCGSLYARTTADLLSHLASVAGALNPGGLYLLDWCINFEWCDPVRDDQSWSVEKDGINIKFGFKMEILDRAAQIVNHRLTMDVDDHGRSLHLEGTDTARVILPQEFLLLVEKSGVFEFIGWWNNWRFEEPIGGAQKIDRPITIIRRL